MLVVGKRKDAAKTPGAFLVGDLFQQSQQFGIVCRIIGIAEFACLICGKSSRVNTRLSVQCIDFQAGIIRQGHPMA